MFKIVIVCIVASSELCIHVGYHHFVFLHLPVSGIVKCALPEHVYCCFTRTTLFTAMFTVIIVVCSLKSMCVPSFIVIGYCESELHGRYCNVLPEAVYYCFTRTTLFTNFLHVCMIRV